MVDTKRNGIQHLDVTSWAFLDFLTNSLQLKNEKRKKGQSSSKRDKLPEEWKNTSII